MATVGTNYNTLADLVARTEPDGSFARKIADRVGRTNQLLQFLPFVRSNKVDGNTIVQATKLPTVGYIKYNKAPTKSKGETVQVTDAISRLKVFSDVDCELADSHVDKEAFRSSEDMLFVEAMNQQVASDLIYSTTVTTPEKFDGLAPRYGAATNVRNNYGYYMISGGGSGSKGKIDLGVSRLTNQRVYATREDVKAKYDQIIGSKKGDAIEGWDGKKTYQYLNRGNGKWQYQVWDSELQQFVTKGGDKEAAGGGEGTKIIDINSVIGELIPQTMLQNSNKTKFTW